MRVNTFFVGWMEGLAQSLDIEKGKISNDFYSTMAVSLNNSLSYQIIIMDPKIQIFSEIPQTYPITRVSFMNQYVGAIEAWNNGKEVPRWGVAEIQKMSPSTTGRCSRQTADQWERGTATRQPITRTYYI